MGKAVGRSLTIAGAILALTFSGCGGGGKESPHRGITAEETGAGKFGSDANGVGFVGADQCVGCHADVDNPITTSKIEGCTSCHQTAPWASNWAKWGGVMDKYFQSGHVLGINTSRLVDASIANDGCNSLCHDPVGDGRSLEATLRGRGAGSRIPAGGLAAVTCEACHGGGGRHFGRRPVPAPTPDQTVCGKCHNATMPSVHQNGDLVNPEGLGIAEDYTTSRHSTPLDTETFQAYLATSGTGISAVCAKCHTDEGARAQAVAGITATDTAAHRVQCRTCHDAHNPGDLLGGGAFAGGSGSDQYKTCTFCHQTASPFDHGPAFAAAGTAIATTDLTIADTHVGLVNSWEASPTITTGVITTIKPGEGINSVAWNDIVAHSERPSDSITGYAISPVDERACGNCHNVHQANVAKDEAEAAADPAASKYYFQWSKSKHADKSAVGPWAHYDWSKSGRASCRRCHTATGSAAYLQAWQEFGSAVAYTAPSVSIGTYKPEMLHCNGCHSANTGVLWRLGTYTGDYAESPGGSLVKFPNVAGSNVCLTCHAGRDSGSAITTSFRNSHYLAAGGVLFDKIGYDFGTSAITTTDPKPRMHQIVGTPALVGAVAPAIANGQGPCVTCHMGEAKDHRFNKVERVVDESGFVTTTTIAEGAICGKCHTIDLAGGPLTPGTLNQERREHRAALAAVEVLLATLADRGTLKPNVYFFPESPYFFTQKLLDLEAALDTGRTSWVAYSKILDDNKFTNWAGLTKNGIGACFNFNMLEHEPGAYAHNKTYVRELLLRTIDWAYNGVFDNDSSTALANLPAKDASLYHGYLYADYDPNLARQYFGARVLVP